jgi:DNA-3-methyladenine glycosylase I
MSEIIRCGWCLGDSDYIEYHDKYWGVPIHDDNILFEMLTLEGAQAGLNWLTILRRKDNYRKSFDNYDLHKIVSYDQTKVNNLLNNPGIIRNKLKINSVLKNAKATLKMLDDGISLNDYFWSYIDYKPIINQFHTLDEVPAKTELSERISKDLKKRGFSFVGPTIVYAFMQAVGMVNDHLISCCRYEELM